ncbi:MAG: hypothetical protein DCE90_06185 [Pseudanabaena sp.]|nr:MAG: hypothetical protein DCE90_06185 [Pseudanabaena sp.]
MEIAIALLRHYGFDFGGYTANDLTRAWSVFHPEWVRQAVIEALFQGRYKAISVNQILIFWERKGEIICHHNREFERLICGDFSLSDGEQSYKEPIADPVKPVSKITPFAPQETTAVVPIYKFSEAVANVPNSIKSESKESQRPRIEPSGTTVPLRLSSEKAPIPDSKVYRSAYENMTLLAESSMFVDKLRSMCIFKNTILAEQMSDVASPVE